MSLLIRDWVRFGIESVRRPDQRAGWADVVLVRLSRVTSGQKLIPEIDGLRFVAIASVFAYHSNTLAVRERALLSGWQDPERLAAWFDESWLTASLAKGYLGVDLFFAISGFILGLPFARHFREGTPPVDLASYFGRRLSRLEVPYLLSLFLAFGIAALLTGNLPWAHLAASCFYIHGLVFGHHSAINPVSWSLEIEVQFYCLAPLLSLTFLPGARWVRIGLLLGLAGLSIYLRTQCRPWLVEWHLHDSILEKLHCFAAGFIAVDLFLEDRTSEQSRREGWYDAAGVLGLTWIFWPIRYSELIEWSCFLPACLAIMTAALRGRVLRGLLRNRWVATLGGMCYSIYLIHYGAMTLASRAIGEDLARVFDQPALNALLFLAVMVPIALAPSAAFFVFVERPCMRRGWSTMLARQILGRSPSDVRDSRRHDLSRR